MMLALLIYCYATGRFGSRTIEAASYSDVAVRYLCANVHPDHSSICEFRVVNEAAFRAAFVSVLQLARELRLSKVGAVSVDGTKIQANASKHAAVSYQRAGEMIEQLDACRTSAVSCALRDAVNDAGSPHCWNCPRALRNMDVTDG